MPLVGGVWGHVQAVEDEGKGEVGGLGGDRKGTVKSMRSNTYPPLKKIYLRNKIPEELFSG